eukprot:6559314-Alexandrium_andersonii.AAC.1
MSASLVGSEMCIRDSIFALCDFSSSFPAGEAPGHREARKRVFRAARRPVSYTHLTLPTICSV